MWKALSKLDNMDIHVVSAMSKLTRRASRLILLENWSNEGGTIISNCFNNSLIHVLDVKETKC